jgi:hypothetical protein
MHVAALDVVTVLDSRTVEELCGTIELVDIVVVEVCRVVEELEAGTDDSDVVVRTGSVVVVVTVVEMLLDVVLGVVVVVVEVIEEEAIGVVVVELPGNGSNS